MGHFFLFLVGLFIQFLIQMKENKNCQYLNLNRGHMVLVATALPKLPKLKRVIDNLAFHNI